jgi:hypothetical protein
VLASTAFDFDQFYPFVPLFVPWERASAQLANEVDLKRLVPAGAHGEGHAAINVRLLAVEQALGPVVEARGGGAAFLTLAQRAAGPLLPGATPLMLRLLAHTLVLNAGGGGDAALPLLGHPWRADELAPLPLGAHDHILSLAGKAHAGVRAEAVHKSLRALGPGRFFLTYAPQTGASQHAHAEREAEHSPHERLWTGVAGRSMLVLAPRGVNPTSFRLFEALQLGLVPVYLFEDGDEQPWLPYHDFSGGLREDGSLSRVSAAARASGQLWHRTAIVLRAGDLDTFLYEALPFLARNATW